jgi:putative phosphoribosyl transferase
MTPAMFEVATPRRQTVEIPMGLARLTGYLTMPAQPRGLVIVASADGEHIYARGNNMIAARLAASGFATLVVDLLTAAEMTEDAETSELRFNQSWVAARVVRLLKWVRAQEIFAGLEIGCLAGGLCAGSVLAASAVSRVLRSVVCRGARFELAGAILDRVHAPVLLLVGEQDTAHLAAHREALLRLPQASQLRVLIGSRHLLDDVSDLDRVGTAAVAWFGKTLAPVVEVEELELAGV